MNRQQLLLLATFACACAPEATPEPDDADLFGLAAERDDAPTLTRLVGAGDIARCDFDGDEQTAALLDRIGGTVFTAGDNAYDSGTPEQFADCFGPTWGRHRARMRPAPGNHEYNSGADGYFDYFGAAAGPDRRGYYSYRRGYWLILSLNSEIDASEGSEQVRWVEQELAANPTRCALAYMHRPLFSSGPHGPAPELRPLYRALHQGGVDVVVAGHDHDYERFLKQDADGNRDEEHGFRLFVVGTGGAPLYGLASQQPNSLKWQNHAHGVIRFTLYPDKYYFKFIPVDGEEYVDQGYRKCN